MSGASTSCRSSPKRLRHLGGRHDKSAPRLPIVAANLLVAAPLVEGNAGERCVQMGRFVSCISEGFFRLAKQRRADAMTRPTAKNVEAHDSPAAEAAESYDAGAGGLGNEIVFPAVSHAPGISVDVQSGGPAFQLGATVGHSPQPAD